MVGLTYRAHPLWELEALFQKYVHVTQMLFYALQTLTLISSILPQENVHMGLVNVYILEWKCVFLKVRIGG